MAKKFSVKVTHLLERSKEEASRLASRNVTPEHLLLGLISDMSSIVSLTLSQMNVNLQAMRLELEQRIRQQYPATEPMSTDSIVLDYNANMLLRQAMTEANKRDDYEVTDYHIMLALLDSSNPTAAREILDINRITYQDFTQNLESNFSAIDHNTGSADIVGDENPLFSSDDDEEEGERKPDNIIIIGGPGIAGGQRQKAGSQKSTTPVLDHFSTDYTDLARQGKLDPVIGRDREIIRLTEILCRRKKNNPVLIGEPGVGKSAIVEGLAQMIADKRTSPMLFDKRLVNLDLSSIVAGTKYRGQFEERIKAILKELEQNHHIIVFIDEIHTMMGAGNASGSMDAANMMKPALARGLIQCIGATTLDEYRKSIEKDGALERRFQKVVVRQTTPAETLSILHNIVTRYEAHHQVHYDEQALIACVKYTERYVSDRQFPDKAIDALDEAGSRVHLRATCPEECNVTEEAVAEVVSTMSGVPVQRVAETEAEQLRNMDSRLKSKVIGQDSAIQKVVKAIQRNRLGLREPNHPIGTFMFLGPTGVGKTYLAKQLALEMFGSQDALIRIDMSEYTESFNTSRLVGAPPGYVGYDEGGQLTERVRRQPYSIVLLDEIEKAHSNVFNMLLQVLDEGRLTDGNGRLIDFRNTVIIMTSNVGTRELKDFGRGVGFGGAGDIDEARNESLLKKALSKRFAPEFLNRMDDIITFDQLQKPVLRRIIDLELQSLVKRVEQMGYTLRLTDGAKDLIAEKGYDVQYGARPLKRALQTYVEDYVCQLLLSGDLKPGQTIKIEKSLIKN